MCCDEATSHAAGDTKSLHLTLLYCPGATAAAATGFEDGYPSLYVAVSQLSDADNLAALASGISSSQKVCGGPQLALHA